MDKNKVIILSVLGGLAALVLVFVVGFFLSRGPGEDSIYNTKAQLSLWAVSDREVSYEKAISEFQKTYPNISINYRRFESLEEYEETLLDSLAAGEGPDIFVIKNSDILRKANKTFPVPESQYSLSNLRNDFPEIVEQDFYFNNKIYALPASVDTLAMIYNKSLFNEAAIVYPAKNWEEFKSQTKKLTEFNDQTGNISRAGAAIGGADNIKYSPDLLSLLMIQSGADMVSDNYGSATFSSEPGREALNFYTQFSNPNSDLYTWDSYLSQDFESFARENNAVVFGYSNDLKDLKERNVFLEIGVAKAPQIKENKEVAVADYFGYAVSRQTRYPTIAWDFVKVLTLDSSAIRSYLENTKRPPALKSLIQEYKDDQELGVFAKQALIAESWKKPDFEKTDRIFDQMIKAVGNKGEASYRVLRNAEDEVSNLLQSL